MSSRRRPASLALAAALAAFVLPVAQGAAQERASGGTINVRVVDPAGTPLPGVTVSLDDGRTVKTDSAGRFRARAAECGAYRLNVRRPGMVGVTTVVEPCGMGATEVQVVLRPIGTVLDPVQVGAKVSGIIGTLIDTQGNPLPDVEVALLGAGAPVRSDSLGQFRILDVKPGAWLLVARDPRVATRRVSVTLLDGDVREMLVPLRPRAGATEERPFPAANAEAAADRDFAERRRTTSDWHVTIGRDELAAARDADLTCALAQVSKVRRVFGQLSLNNCNQWSVPTGCIIIDGWRDGVRPLNWIFTDEVEFVELYRGAPARSPAVQSRTTCPDELPMAFVWTR
jgi:hypothetical protein